MKYFKKNMPPKYHEALEVAKGFVDWDDPIKGKRPGRSIKVYIPDAKPELLGHLVRLADSAKDLGNGKWRFHFYAK